MENLFNNYYLNSEDPIDEVTLKQKDPYKKFSKLREKRTAALNDINKFYADNNANRVLRTISDRERLQKRSEWQGDIKRYKQMLKELKETERVGKTYYDAIGRPSNLTPYQLITTPEGYGAIKRARDKGILDDRSFLNYMDKFGRGYDPMGYQMTPEEARKYEDVRMTDVDAFASKINKLAMAAPLLGGAGALSAATSTLPYTIGSIGKSISPYLTAPLTIGSKVYPYINPATVTNLGFGLHGASNISEDIKKGNYGEAAFDALEILGSPGMGNLLKTSYNTAKNVPSVLSKEYDKVATGNSFLTDFGVPAWKVEQNAINPKSSEYITRNYTDAEAKVLSKYGEGMNLTPEEWKVMEGITKSGATKFSGDYPITRVIDYYNKYTPENEAIKKLKVGNTFKTPEEKAIRTWTAGARPAEEYLEGSTRLVIPSRYTKNLGSNFAGMPYYDKRVGFIWGDRGLNTNAVLEKELMGNIPEGFKVIGKSKDGGFNNLIIKPTNYSSASNANLNTGTESINSIFNNKYLRGFRDLGRIADEALGELIQGKENRRAIERGNKWLEEWINHPVTQQKIIESKPNFSRLHDSNYLQQFNIGKDQARTFKPISKEYSFKNQLKDLINKREHIHKGNMGVSYPHVLTPEEIQGIEYFKKFNPKKLDELDPRLLSSWISRNRSINQANRESTTIHEGTHDWVNHFMLENTQQKRHIEDLLSDSAYDKYRTWKNLRNQGINPVNKMGEMDAYLGYLADPTEVHARIMEVRRALGLTPKDYIGKDKAMDIIRSLNEGKLDTKIDPRFLENFDNNPRAIADLFNTLWYADPKNADPVLQQQMNDPLFKAKGGSLNKPKNIPTYYNFSGTPIYRNTTSLPFRYGGGIKNYYPVGGYMPTDGGSDGGSKSGSKQLINFPIIDQNKINYETISDSDFTPGFEKGATLDVYNKAFEEKQKSASSLKTAKTELEEEQRTIEEGTERMMEAAERALYDDQYNKIFKYKLPEGSFYCQTRNCELDRIAGRKTVKDTTLFGRNIPAGSLIPVAPGVGSFVSKINPFGYVPVDYKDRKRGDVVIIRRSPHDPAHLGVHSIRYAGNDTYYEDHGGGYVYDKTKYRHLNNPVFFRYVGNTPALQAKVGEAEKELSKASEQFHRTELPRMKTMPIPQIKNTYKWNDKKYDLNAAGQEQLLKDQNNYLANMINLMSGRMRFGGNMYGHGGHMYDLFTHGTYGKGGQLIKRADGSYSRRGLWDNIRANKGSGKKPTKEMLKQERKIKRNS